MDLASTFSVVGLLLAFEASVQQSEEVWGSEYNKRKRDLLLSGTPSISFQKLPNTRESYVLRV
jgi:hypothetical protein